ncbi:MAG: hypothetical protein EOO89_24595 [Pedobacter sp.]|nr:MAG: hypothetical protein EOO89_24595 [Pedobacter sp.]
MIFKTSLDKTAIVITIGVTILFAVIIAGQFAFIKNAEHSTPIYTTVGLVLIYLLAFTFRPIDYLITAEEVVIRRPLKNVRIKRLDIAHIELVDKTVMIGSVRTFGVGGLFGYYGSFANLSLGSMTWYTTRRDTAVLLKTRTHKKIILTPNEPERFIAQFNS